MREQEWQKTPVSNLIRYISSGIYFARLRVGGKLIRRSLKTDRLSVAQLRLADLVKVERQGLEFRSSATKGKMIFDEALSIYRERLEKNPALKPSAKLYRHHKDGGALAMKVYGHLRDQHSVNMAQKVSFSH